MAIWKQYQKEEPLHAWNIANEYRKQATARQEPMVTSWFDNYREGPSHTDSKQVGHRRQGKRLTPESVEEMINHRRRIVLWKRHMQEEASKTRTDDTRN